MTFSGTSFAALLMVLSIGMPTLADSPLDLLRRHRYEESIRLWEREVQGSQVSEDMLRALKGQAIAYFKLGSLYEEFNRFSTSLMEEYYSALLPESASPLIYLYLGQLHFYKGNYAQAKVTLEKAKAAGLKGANEEMAEVYLFYANSGEGSGKTYGGTLLSEEARWQALALRGGKTDDASKGLKAQSARSKRARLEVVLNDQLVNDKELEQALNQVLAESSLPEQFENEGKQTQINFYDPYLMNTLSKSYYRLSKLKNLRLSASEKKFPRLADKLNTDLSLAEVSLELGELREADGYISKVEGPAADIVRANILARKGKKDDSRQLLEKIVKANDNSEVKRNVAKVYFENDFELERALKLAKEASSGNKSSSYSRIYASILFGIGEFDEALRQYAMGYKIAYRNRIDQIDPEYMSEYSFSVFRVNKLRYEEVVETLYHLQKEFPACRQMYYCMQGVFASFAKNYDTQTIFRKGG